VTKTDDPPEVLERFHAELELVEIVARQVARSVGPHAELGDLLSFGREGLLDAARRFDPDRGVPFRGYANFRVKGAIIDGVRSMARLPRRVHARLQGLAAASRFSEGAFEDLAGPPPPGSTSAGADLALSDHLAGMATAIALGLVATTGQGEEGERVGIARGEDPEEATAQSEVMTLVREAIAGLPEEEAELVRRHYLEGERFDHVAEELGLSKSWASRLHTRALGRLTKRLREV
jgi:RNA polymerase sigma factor for flagellar operon FliA